MNEELNCGCKNTGCHFCDVAEDIWASMRWEDAEGGECCLHICGECGDNLISNKITIKAKKELGWIDDRN